MKTRLTTLLALAGLILTVPGIAGAADTYEIDKPHTMLTFSVDRQGMTRVIGRFTDMSGTITIDEANPVASSAELSIATASVYSGYEPRDKALRGPNFFNSQEFPAMTFKSTGVTKTGDKTATLTGDLTLLGISRQVSLDVVLNKTKPNDRAKKIFAGFTLTGKFKRSDFGMKYGLAFIGDEIDLHLEVLAARPM